KCKIENHWPVSIGLVPGVRALAKRPNELDGIPSHRVLDRAVAIASEGFRRTVEDRANLGECPSIKPLVQHYRDFEHREVPPGDILLHDAGVENVGLRTVLSDVECDVTNVK